MGTCHPDPNARVSSSSASFGWSWIGIGISDCEPAGGCRLAQSESRFHGAQQRQSVSQPVGVWAALCSCALLHSLSSRQRRGGRREEGWGSGQAPSPVARTTNGSGAARTERTSYLSTRPTSVRAGDFPPSSVREARVNKGLRPLNRAFFNPLFKYRQKSSFFLPLIVHERHWSGRAVKYVCMCVATLPSSCSFILMNNSPGHPALAPFLPPSLLSLQNMCVWFPFLDFVGRPFLLVVLTTHCRLRPLRQKTAPSVYGEKKKKKKPLPQPFGGFTAPLLFSSTFHSVSSRPLSPWPSTAVSPEPNGAHHGGTEREKDGVEGVFWRQRVFLLQAKAIRGKCQMM